MVLIFFSLSSSIVCRCDTVGYSGMSKAILDNVSTRIEQVQCRLLCILRPQDILVGHSLENDLQSLRLIHKSVIVTAIFFQRQIGSKRKYCKYSVRFVGKAVVSKFPDYFTYLFGSHSRFICSFVIF